MEKCSAYLNVSENLIQAFISIPSNICHLGEVTKGCKNVTNISATLICTSLKQNTDEQKILSETSKAGVAARHSRKTRVLHAF